MRLDRVIQKLPGVPRHLGDAGGGKRGEVVLFKNCQASRDILEMLGGWWGEGARCYLYVHM